jgi:hypothetical protein
VLVAVVTLGCQAASSTTSAVNPSATPGAPTPAGAQTKAPTGGPTAGGPGGSPIPSLVRLDLDPGGPILRAADGPATSEYVMPAAGARARDGTLVLAVVWFRSGDARPVVTLVRSADGATWAVDRTDILAGLAIGDPRPGPIPSALLELDDGSWQMFGSASADQSGTRFWSWRTSAPALDGPWTVDAIEMLDPGPAGSWDSQVATAASVQRDGDGYLLWYEGEPPGRAQRGDIGLATSPDGLDWTKFDDSATAAAPYAESDPVIATGICGAGTAVAVEQPQVERVGDGFLAVFAGFGAAREWMDVWAAVSDDGRSWRCATPEPLLSGEDIPGSEGIHTMASMPLADGRIGLVLESLGDASSELWWATVRLNGP